MFVCGLRELFCAVLCMQVSHNDTHTCGQVVVVIACSVVSLPMLFYSVCGDYVAAMYTRAWTLGRRRAKLLPRLSNEQRQSSGTGECSHLYDNYVYFIYYDC